MNRRKPAPNYRAEAESLAALYGAGDATADLEAGRQQSARARRLGALVALAGHRELAEVEREELGRLVAGNPNLQLANEEPK